MADYSRNTLLRDDLWPSVGAASVMPPAGLNPMRARHIEGWGTISADRTGRFVCSESQIEATADNLNDLRRWGLATQHDDQLERLSHRARALARRAQPSPLDYLILVPTLRCDLACSYCQVSRVQQDASGFDWTDDTVAAVEAMIDALPGDQIKIEFQGGEPTLRVDIIQRVLSRCERFAIKSFVICTNLSRISDDLVTLLERDDVILSTSLDGPSDVHRRQRTLSEAATEQFQSNLEWMVRTYGPDKVSALPTIDQTSPPDPDDLIAAYERFGLHSIYLRPVNFQGFARKRHKASQGDHADWWAYHERFIRRLIVLNFDDKARLREESYFSLCLRRMFRIGLDRHVDLRNPNPLGVDYLVIDYDGAIYPTDEARMLTRSGIVDLAIGDVRAGVDGAKRDLLNAHSTNLGDPDCEHCPYQAFCGRDIVDDLSRYGRIDLPRHETFFCQRHLAMFDLAMKLVYSEDPATQYSLAKWLGLASHRLPWLPRL